MSLLRTRWAAIGAAVAITLGAGGIGIVSATISSGSRTVFVPITPCRIMDTRTEFPVGPRTSPLGADETYVVDAHGTNGNCTLPSDADGLALNVTTTDATLVTFLTIWGDVARPTSSSLNPQPGQPPTPNAVTTDLTNAGKFKIYNKQGTVNVFVDVVGYYADHNHDDRYYTQDEIDAGKAISLDPTGWHKEGGAFYLASAGTRNTGIVLPAASAPGVTMSAVLPPDATPGGDLRLDIFWHIKETGCAAGLAENFSQATRLGNTELSESTTSIPYITRGPVELSEVRRYSVLWTSPEGFNPGDIVKYGLWRSPLISTCTEDVFIDAARLLYDYGG